MTAYPNWQTEIVDQELLKFERGNEKRSFLYVPKPILEALDGRPVPDSHDREVAIGGLPGHPLGKWVTVAEASQWIQEMMDYGWRRV